MTSAMSSPTKERVREVKPVSVVERQHKQPDMYRLYIYDDPFNKRERVVDVLLKTCQGLSFSRAYSAMQEAHENGRGLVLVIAQEIAEHYCSCINTGWFLLSYFFPFSFSSFLLKDLSMDADVVHVCVMSCHAVSCHVCVRACVRVLVAGVYSTVEPNN